MSLENRSDALGKLLVRAIEYTDQYITESNESPSGKIYLFDQQVVNESTLGVGFNILGQYISDIPAGRGCRRSLDAFRAGGVVVAMRRRAYAIRPYKNPFG
jgi:hypothetical protein